MCRLYVTGLIEREGGKNVHRMAARLGQPSHDAMHHFISSGSWDTGALEAALAAEAGLRAGSPNSFLVIGEVVLPKKGTRSVGVAPQPVGAAGRILNCQVLVSLTLVRGVVPVPVGLRLFLPESWTGDGERMERARVPENLRMPRSKAGIALAELDRVASVGARFGCVLVDAEYGMSAEFRRGMKARRLRWAVAVPGGITAVPASAASRSRPAMLGARAQGAEEAPRPIQSMLAEASWWQLTWQRRADEWLPVKVAASFAALRARLAEEKAGLDEGAVRDLPGGQVWIIGERRDGGEARHYASNLPAGSSLRTLAGTVKGRWVAERALQLLREELGLDDFEGRSWVGLHRHALMSMLAYAFLQQEGLAGAKLQGAEG
ncbi:IS701 family transposase [Roseomonas sp. KE2513]|nr:IS701 family transposase [Roseomonas sp. KE2513]